MNLLFETRRAAYYTSKSQIIRILSEHWVGKQAYCPSCGQQALAQYSNNRPVADFLCALCDEEYELKSGKTLTYTKLVDGSYGTMIDRLNSNRNPSLFLISYDAEALSVIDFLVIPKHFFTPDIIEPRKPLSSSARRAGWTGCNILLHGIPQAGRIFLVRNGVVESRRQVVAKWQKTLFLREQSDKGAKGWLLTVMQCLERLKQHTFSLDQVYSFEKDLQQKFPDNLHIRAKIRQQLQILRDQGYLEFLGRGTYRMVEEGQ